MDVLTLAVAATPSFIASSVEFVEALTIVLAVGTTRGWRAPLVGAALAALTLAAIVAVIGVALVTIVPRHILQIVVGVMSQVRVEAMSNKVHDFKPGPDGLTGTPMNDAWLEG